MMKVMLDDPELVDEEFYESKELKIPHRELEVIKRDCGENF